MTELKLLVTLSATEQNVGSANYTQVSSALEFAGFQLSEENGSWQCANPTQYARLLHKGSPLQAQTGQVDQIELLESPDHYNGKTWLQRRALLLARSLGWQVFSHELDGVIARPIADDNTLFQPDTGFIAREKNTVEMLSCHISFEKRWRPKALLLAKDENPGLGCSLSALPDGRWLYGFREGADRSKKPNRLQVRDENHTLLKDLPQFPPLAAVSPDGRWAAVYTPLYPNRRSSVALLDLHTYETHETPLSAPIAWLSGTKLLGFSPFKADELGKKTYNSSTEILCNWDIQTEQAQHLHSAPASDLYSHDFVALRLSAAGDVVFIARASEISAVNRKSGDVLWRMSFASPNNSNAGPAPHHVKDIDLSHCGRYLGIVSDPGDGSELNSCVVLDSQTGERLMSMPLRNKHSYLSCIRWHRRGWFAVSNSQWNCNPTFVDLSGQTRDVHLKAKGALDLHMADDHVILVGKDPSARTFTLLPDERGEEPPEQKQETSADASALKSWAQLKDEVKSKSHVTWLTHRDIRPIDRDYTQAIPLLLEHLSADHMHQDAALYLLRTGSDTLRQQLQEGLLNAEQGKHKTQAKFASYVLARQAHYDSDWADLLARMESLHAVVRTQCLKAIISELQYLERTSPTHAAIVSALQKKAKTQGVRSGTSTLHVDVDKSIEWPPNLPEKHYIEILSIGLQDKAASVRQSATELIPILIGDFKLPIHRVAPLITPILQEKSPKTLQLAAKAATAMLGQQPEESTVRALLELIYHSNGRVQEAALSALRVAAKQGVVNDKAMQQILQLMPKANRHTDVAILFFAQHMLANNVLMPAPVLALIEGLENRAFTNFTGRQVGGLLAAYAEKTPELMPRIESALLSNNFMQQANQIARLRLTQK